MDNIFTYIKDCGLFLLEKRDLDVYPQVFA